MSSVSRGTLCHVKYWGGEGCSGEQGPILRRVVSAMQSFGCDLSLAPQRYCQSAIGWHTNALTSPLLLSVCVSTNLSLRWCSSSSTLSDTMLSMHSVRQQVRPCAINHAPV